MGFNMCKAKLLKLKLPGETRIGEISAMLLTTSIWFVIVNS